MKKTIIMALVCIMASCKLAAVDDTASTKCFTREDFMTVVHNGYMKGEYHALNTPLRMDSCWIADSTEVSDGYFGKQ